MAELVHSKVATGECASPSDVVQDDLEALMEPDPRAERWLREEVVPAIDAYQADPSTIVPIDEVVESLSKRHACALAGA